MGWYKCLKDCQYAEKVYKLSEFYEFAAGVTPSSALFEASTDAAANSRQRPTAINGYIDDNGRIYIRHADGGTEIILDDQEIIISGYDPVDLSDLPYSSIDPKYVATQDVVMCLQFESPMHDLKAGVSYYENVSSAYNKISFIVNTAEKVAITQTGLLVPVSGSRVTLGNAINSTIYIDWYNGNTSLYGTNSELKFKVNATDLVEMTDGEFQFMVTPKPNVDDTLDLGASDLRFNDVYATNATIQTSDETLKDEIADTLLGADFLELLRPVSFKWKDVETPAVTEEVTGARQKVETIETSVQVPKIEMIDGKAVRRMVTEIQIEDKPVTELVPVYDEEGNVIEGLKHEVPVMEEYTETKVIDPYTSRTYNRTHFGLIAQELETAIKDLGIATEDFAPLIIDEETGRYGIRYAEFVPILIKAVQDLSLEIESLKS